MKCVQRFPGGASSLLISPHRNKGLLEEGEELLSPSHENTSLLIGLGSL